MDTICLSDRTRPEPWNKGKLIGQKPPLKAREVWSIRIRLQIADHKRDLALFNLAIDSKLRSCDLVRLRVGDLWIGGEIRHRAKLLQSKTGAPVQFEVTPQTRAALEDWRSFKGLAPQDWLFPSRKDPSRHITTRQYARIVDRWVSMIGLQKSAYGTHSLRRTKATIIYRKTGNVRAVQLLLGHTKLDSTVRYLGVELEDALELAESIEL
ncbi:MAG: tyrosine-type recombinase/integrase [Maricaulis sp.]|uniref:tyrosine-type recombinase/integrase n=1 Tax=Maricaulis sp. TaxID=1486257 RepID=UPI001B07F4A0|nr:tyrosine-type recombinase/integrase [Maricaulis sp.]MBO6696910.1 tyrosine-type recombinase/integrase [Henriciella sp.]MBO6730826.1 tyrosine-type recombinase/integrase [Maricaulis sp.]MBO6878395.1 tyrosine-type recombinase/integrase [Maricaulis sp.]